VADNSKIHLDAVALSNGNAKHSGATTRIFRGKRGLLFRQGESFSMKFRIVSEFGNNHSLETRD
jgi:hypothetical protein